MNFDTPKLPLQPRYVFERSYLRMGKGNCANSDSAKKENLPEPEAPDLGGYPVRVIGTTNASGTSVSIVQTYEIQFIPRYSVIPAYEMQRHLLACNMELAQEIDPVKQKNNE